MTKQDYKAKKIAELRNIKTITFSREDVETFLSQTIDELWNNSKADIIVDLYEMKASLNRPKHIGEKETPNDIYRYHFLMTIIAKLCDINDIQGEEIEDAIRRRAEAERMRDLSIKRKV